MAAEPEAPEPEASERTGSEEADSSTEEELVSDEASTEEDGSEPAGPSGPRPAPPAPDPVDDSDEARVLAAESRRLRQELVKVARLARHDAVDRLYEDLVALGEPIPGEIHVYAADSARARGDMMRCVARLHTGGGTDEFADVAARFGTVRLSVSVPGAQLRGAERFAPDETNAVAWVNERLTEDGRFVGLLPAGEYELANRAIVVPAGGAVSVVVD